MLLLPKCRGARPSTTFTGRLRNRLLAFLAQIRKVVLVTDLYTAAPRQIPRAFFFAVLPASLFDGSVLPRRKLAGQRKLSKPGLDAGLTFYLRCYVTPTPYVRNTGCNSR